MSYKQLAVALSSFRKKANLLPRRFKKSIELTSLRQNFEITGMISLVIGCLFFIYNLHPQHGLIELLFFPTHEELEFIQALLNSSGRVIIWAFALIFLIPTIISLFISSHQKEATTKLTSPHYFYIHFGIAAWLLVLLAGIINILLPFLFSILNHLFSTHLKIGHLWFDDDLVFLCAGAVIWLTYEFFLIYEIWTENKTVKHSPKNNFGLWVGKSTGTLAKRQHGSGIKANQHIALTLEDAAKNIMILGGIGSGKTSCAISPLLLQLLQQNCGGLVFDIKGDFHDLVMRQAKALRKENRIVHLGIGGLPINIIEGTLPEMATSFLKSAFLADGRARGESAFWTDQATNLCTSVLGLLVHLPERYNLKDMYDYIFNPTVKADITRELELVMPALDAQELRLLTHHKESIERDFESFNEKTRNDIRATITQVLMPFRNPAMADAFCQPSHLQMENILDGTIYLLNLPLGTYGIAARVVYTFIKLRFFNLMQSRVNNSQWNQTNPVFFMCDEYQDIVTGNTGGLSDLNFWDKSRSSKTIGIITSQSLSSFHAAIGDNHISNAVLQNFRQKICFSTEDQPTFDFFSRVTGTVEIKKRTVSKHQGTSTTGWNINGSSNQRSKTETISYVKEQVIDPQLMRNLQPQHAIAILTLQGHSCDDVLTMQAVF